MVAFFCIGIGELLLFASMVLGILINVGQITTNMVARNIYYTSLDTTGFEQTIRNIANQNNVNVDNIYAANQASPELAGNGIKNVYRWGLYNFCAGAQSGSDVACDGRSFGYDFRPLDVLQQDIGSEFRTFVTTAVPAKTFADQSYTGKYTNAANYIAFVGTVVVGAAFLVAFLAHRFAFLLAALLALAAAALLFVSSAIWTAIIYRVRHSIADQAASAGIDVHYGNAIWMCWAAAAAAVLAVVPMLIACISGRRSKY